MLDSMGCEPSTVLDLYAGSGALGIEALSRGARHAAFVERNAAACGVIRLNLAHAGFADRAQVICATVARSIARLRGPYDLIFVDPPYADSSIEQALSVPSASSLWGKDTLLVFEHSRRDQPPARLGTLAIQRTRSHGTSSVSFYAPATGSGAEGVEE